MLYVIMCDLHADFASSWKEYSVKHNLDTDQKCLEHAIRASFTVENTPPSVFDWKRYIRDYPDLQRAFGRGTQVHVNDATSHYLNYGIRENRSVFILGTNDPYVYDFDWEKYNKLNPDVFTGRNRYLGKWYCFRHWCEYGHIEDRETGCIRIVVNNSASISSDEEVNQLWRKALSNVLQLHTFNSIEDIVKLLRVASSEFNPKTAARSASPTFLLNNYRSNKINSGNFGRPLHLELSAAEGEGERFNSAGDSRRSSLPNIQIVSTSVVCYKLFETFYNIKPFVSQDTSDIVIIWNIDTTDNRQIFDYRKKNHLAVFCIERGCLPNTVYIDDNESIYKTDKFKHEIWNKPLCEKEYKIITEYIQQIKTQQIAVEIQNIRDISTMNINGFKQIIFCPLQRRYDTSITQYGGWIESVENFYLIMKKISVQHKDILFLIKNHPTEILLHRYKDQTINFRFVDKYHVNDLIKLCDKVILINSGVGIFSMMYNKPCGILGESFYHIPDVNVKINNYQDIITFIENKSITVNEDAALRYLYYLKFQYLYDAQQTKDISTNKKTVFNSSDILIRLNTTPSAIAFGHGSLQKSNLKINKVVPELLVIIPYRNRLTQLKSFFSCIHHNLTSNWLKFIVVSHGDYSMVELCNEYGVEYDVIGNHTEPFNLLNIMTYASDTYEYDYIGIHDIDCHVDRNFFKKLLAELHKNQFMLIGTYYLSKELSDTIFASDNYANIIQQFIKLNMQRKQYRGSIPYYSKKIYLKSQWSTFYRTLTPYSGHGAEDFVFAHVLNKAGFIIDTTTIRDYPGNFKEASGIRKLVEMYNNISYNENLLTYHKWHEQMPANNSNWTKWSSDIQKYDNKRIMYESGVVTKSLINQHYTNYNSELIKSDMNFLQLIETDKVFAFFIHNPYNPAQKWRLKLIELCRQYNINCYVVERGGLLNTYYIDKTHFCTKSTISKYSYFERFQLTLKQTLYIEKYIENYIKSEQSLEKQIHDNSSTINTLIQMQKKIIFVPLQNPNDVTIIHDSGFAQSFDNFLDIVHRLSINYESEYIFVVKPHPIDHTNLSVYAKRLPKCKFYVFDFRTILKHAKYVLLINSGIGLESLLYGKTVLVCGNTYYKHPRLNINVSKLEDIYNCLDGRSNFKLDKNDVNKYIYFLVKKYYSTSHEIKNEDRCVDIKWLDPYFT